MTARSQIRSDVHRRAEQAWEVHAALLLMEARRPDLRDNPEWIIIRQDAFENFYLALDRIV